MFAEHQLDVSWGKNYSTRSWFKVVIFTSTLAHVSLARRRRRCHGFVMLLSTALQNLFERNDKMESGIGRNLGQRPALAVAQGGRDG